MAKKKFECSKPHVNVGIIGYANHGKTILIAALTTVLAKKLGGIAKACDQVNSTPEEKAHGITINTSRVEYETKARHYAHVDCPGRADYVKGMITGAAQMDGAILVCPVADSPVPQTREHIPLVRQVGVPYVITLMDKCNMVDNAELLELAEMEICDLLPSCDFPGDDCPIIQGSAPKALEDDAAYEEEAFELAAVLGSYIPTPERAVDEPSLLLIEDVFPISGHGTVVTGRIERGIIHVSGEIEIVGLEETQRATYTGIEMFRRLLGEDQAGDSVGVLLRDTKYEEVERGQVLAKSGTITPHTRFKAGVYVLSGEGGGRHIPLFTNYHPQFYFRTTDVTGAVILEEGTEMVMPDKNVAIAVELTAPTAMGESLHFTIREGGRTIGTGVVSSIIT